MAIIYLLLGCSIGIALVFLFLFIWSLRSGQYDDPQTPAIRMLFENRPSRAEEDDHSSEEDS